MTALRSPLQAGVALAAAAVLASSCSVHRLSDDQALATGTGAAGATATSLAITAGRVPIAVDAAGNTLPGGASPTLPPGASTSAAAPGGDAGRPPAENLPSSEPRVASDQGVTPDEIRLGILHTSSSFITAAGGDETDPVAEILAPFIAEVNEQGGINGRTVAPRITEYDPLSADSMQAACVEQAEDHQVFAAIAQVGFYGDAEVCMASKEVPLLTGNNSSYKTNHDRERGWVHQTAQNKDRNVRNWIDWMIATGLLSATTRTGLIYVDVPEDRDLVNEVVLPHLQSRGMAPPVLATLSSSIAQTPAEAQSAVLRFRSEDVRLVLPLVSFLRILIFAEQAEAALYRPGYSVSDFGLLNTDAMAGMPPEQWSGVTGISTYRAGEWDPNGLPASAEFAECNGVYERYGQHIDVDESGRPNGLEVAYMLHYCEHIALWADAARRAGANPTRASFLQALETTGTWSHRVALTAPLTFAPGKYDGADLYAVVRWEPDCTPDGGCYRQVEGFRPGAW